MKKIFVLINILSLCLSLFAQTKEEINTLIKNGVYAENRGDFKKAIIYFEHSKEDLEKLNKTNEDIYVIVLYKLVGYYRNIGDYTYVKKYIEKGAKVLDIIEEDNPQFIVFSYNIADCYYAIDNYSRAIEINNKAMEICKRIKGENSSDYLRVLRNTSHYYNKKGDYFKAIELYTKEGNIIRTVNGENNPEYATALNHLANCYSDLGDYPHALEYGTKALEIRKSVLGEFHPDYAESLSNLTTYYNYLHDYSHALEYGNNALKIRKSMFGEFHSDYASSLNNLAFCYFGLEKYDKAIELGTKALEIERCISGENYSAYEIYLNNLALYYSFKGDKEKAIELYYKALNKCESSIGDVSPEYSALLTNLALCYYSCGDILKAKKLGLEALKIQKKVMGDKHPQYVALLNFIAVCEIFSGNYQDALNIVTESISLCTSNIIQFFGALPSHTRSSYWESVSYLFTDLFPYVSYQTHSNNISDLYNLSALFSKGILLNTDMDMRDLIFESGDSLLIAKYKKMLSNISIYNKQIEIPINRRFINTDSLNNVIQQQETELIMKSRVYGNYANNLKLSWKNVQERLDDNDIAIEFLNFPIYGSDSIMYVALILKKEYECPHLVKLFVANQLKAISEDVYYSHTYISDLVWKPLEEELRGVTDIYFAPSGELHRIGIEYLPISKTKNISDIYTLHRLSSTRQLAVIQDLADGKSTILYGGINYDKKSNVISKDFTFTEGAILKTAFNRTNVDSLSVRSSFDYLEGTKREADMIAKDMMQHHIPYIYYSGIDGTEESFKQLSGTKPKVMHIATHGFYYTKTEAEKPNFARSKIDLKIVGIQNADGAVEDKPMTRSGLLFSGCNRTFCHEQIREGEEDGILTAQEIAALDLRGLDLVVLSACHTGLGDVVSGEGVFGLQRGFKRAGANTILMSLGKVDDEATRILMVDFYRNMMNGNTKQKSLQEAQKFLRKVENRKYDDPKYWASFIMLDGLD